MIYQLPTDSFEARMCIKTAKYFVLFEMDGETAPELPKPSQKVEQKSLYDCVRLATVDKFQGEEAETVIVSLVRFNKQWEIDFLKSPNRVNVMLSRAKHGMFIYGSSRTILGTYSKRKKSEVDSNNSLSLLAQAVQKLQKNKLFGP